MAIKLVNQKWNPYVGDHQCEFIVDSNADFENLPESCVGGTALCPKSGTVMVVNASGEWVKFGG